MINDFGANALVRKDFKEKAVGLRAGDQMNPMDAAFQCGDRTVGLGDHTLADGAVGDKPRHFVRFERRDEGLGLATVPHDAGHIAEVHQPSCPEGGGDVPGGGIGIGVVDLAGCVASDRRDDGNAAVVECFFNRFDLDGANLADKAEIEFHSIDDDFFFITEQNAVAGYPEWFCLSGSKDSAYFRIDGSIERPFDDTDGFSIGDAQSVLETGFDLGFGQGSGDGFAPAVHDDDLNSDGMKKSDVGGYAGTHFRVCVIHEGTAVFDDEDGALKASDVGKRFEKYGRFFNGGRMFGGSHGDRVVAKGTPNVLFAFVEVHVGFAEIGGEEAEAAFALIQIERHAESVF